MSDILSRHRVAALLGAALIISPFVVSFAQSANNMGASNAVPTTQTPVAGITAPNGSFAPIVATDKPAVVTVTTVVKAQPQGMSEDYPFDGGSPFAGPILDQDGNEVVAEGDSLDYVEAETMDFFVQGVVGTVG